MHQQPETRPAGRRVKSRAQEGQGSALATYVLVPGGWRGGWACEPVSARLRRLGHTVHALTLPGLGDDSADVGGINLDAHIAHVVQAVTAVTQADNRGPVVLCGHSYAGMVITAAADRAADQVQRLVYLDAFVPDDGQSWWDLANDHYRSLVLAGARRDGLTVTPPAGSDSRERSQPLGTFLQGVSLTGAHWRIPRRTLVFASRWPGTPFRPQYEKLRHDPQWETHELTTGHDVMREAPDDVVAVLTS
jgi:pimeloyl-ACP methyl ester carboxylesterase